MHFQVVRAQAHTFAAVEHHRAKIGVRQFVLAHRVDLRLVDLFLGVRNLHVQDVGTVEQPVGVFLEPENGRAPRGLIGTHAFEHAHAVVQGVGQHMGLGFAPRHHFIVQPDKTVSLSHRHGGHTPNPQVELLFRKIEPVLPDRPHAVPQFAELTVADDGLFLAQ